MWISIWAKSIQGGDKRPKSACAALSAPYRRSSSVTLQLRRQGARMSRDELRVSQDGSVLRFAGRRLSAAARRTEARALAPLIDGRARDSVRGTVRRRGVGLPLRAEAADRGQIVSLLTIRAEIAFLRLVPRNLSAGYPQGTRPCRPTKLPPERIAVAQPRHRSRARLAPSFPRIRPSVPQTARSLLYAPPEFSGDQAGAVLHGCGAST